jgi:hypothetical protein
MIRKKGISSVMILGFLAMAALLFAIARAYAGSCVPSGTPVNCSLVNANSTVDSDCDGFSDYWECQAGGLPAIDPNLPAYTGLDPVKPDLFLFVVPAGDSTPLSNLLLTGFDPFEFAKKLPIRIHFLDYNTYRVLIDLYGRILSNVSFQKALVIKENLDTNGDALGFSLPGVPSGSSNIDLYTVRIWQKLVAACPCLGSPDAPNLNANCPDCVVDPKLAGSVTGTAIYPYYVKNIIAHEIGHRVRPLVYPYSTRYEYHYKAGSKTEMEQFTTSASRKGTVTFYISNDYLDADRTVVNLVP